MNSTTAVRPSSYWGRLRPMRATGTASLFLRAFVPFVLVLLLATAALYSWRIHVMDRDLDYTLTVFLTLVGDRLERELRTPAEDLRFLASEFAGTPAAEVDTMAQLLQNLSRSRGRYDTVRLLDRSGMERVRVESAARNWRLASASELTDWSQSTLFVQAMRVAPPSVYASSFELRTERGKVAEPFRPIIRFAAPYGDGTTNGGGLIIIDLDARPMLLALRVANPNGYLELLTSDGYWVKARDPQLEWGSVLRERQQMLFSTRNARAWGEMTAKPAGQVRSGKGSFWFRTVRAVPASATAPQWKLVLYAPEDRMRARELGLGLGFAMLAVAAAALAAPFCWWLARRASEGRQAVSF